MRVIISMAGNSTSSTGANSHTVGEAAVPRFAAPARVLIIGAGYAGTRMVRALNHPAGSGAGREPGRIMDVQPAKLHHWSIEGVPVFDELKIAMHTTKPDVVAVTVNEYAHLEVLRTVSSAGIRFVLCEKPLASTLAEAEEVRNLLGSSTSLSLNMVERFSDVVHEARRWLAAAGPVEVLRVEFHWGKHRIADPRPTIGVLSEIIHPIDLLRLLFDSGHLYDVRGCSTTTQLRGDGPVCMDSIDFAAQAEPGYTVIGHASFSWPRRVRTLSAIVRDDCCRLYRLEPHLRHSRMGFG